MTRILLLLLALAVSPVVCAKVNWLRLGEDTRTEIFIDSFSIERPPAYIKMWTLLQYKSRQRGGWLSEKRLFVFSCKERTLEWQQSMYYSDAMGEGDFLHARTLNQYGVGDLRLIELDPSTKDQSKYKDAVPESAFISVFKDLC